MSEPGSRRVAEEAAGERLDVWLARVSGSSRNQVQNWIRDGRVRVDGEAVRPAHALRRGERVEWEPPPPTPDPRVEPEEGELAVLHEDPAVVAVDKPAGLVVHPGAGRTTGTLVHRLLARYPEMALVGGSGRPGIVHRLDKDTTGVLLAARTPEAHRRLAAAFARRNVEKLYLALAWGRPDPPAARIDQPIGRHPRRRKEMTVRPEGRPAVSEYHRLAQSGRVCLLLVRLHTGRTHQIRIHLKWARHPLVGDPVYGEARWKAVTGRARRALKTFPRPALHAWRIGVDHPTGEGRLTVEAPPPQDLVELWKAVGGGNLEGILPSWPSPGPAPP